MIPTQSASRLLTNCVPHANGDFAAYRRVHGSRAEERSNRSTLARRMRFTVPRCSDARDIRLEVRPRFPPELGRCGDYREGFVVVLHVVVVPIELAVARVADRVVESGHSVPEEKIRERFERLWLLVVDAIDRSDHAPVYDNTAPDVTRIVARFVDGDPVGAIDWPAWAPAELLRTSKSI